mgnify:CR=1 FL=1
MAKGEPESSEITQTGKIDPKGKHIQSPSIIDVMKPLFYENIKSNQSENNFGSEKGGNDKDIHSQRCNDTNIHAQPGNDKNVHSQ